MEVILAQLAITTALLMLVASTVKGVEVASWGSAFLMAIVLGILNALVRPIMVVLTIPFTIITFGLFLFVLNALILWMAASLVPGVRIAGFGAALLGSLLLTLLNVLVTAAFGISLAANPV